MKTNWSRILFAAGLFLAWVVVLAVVDLSVHAAPFGIRVAAWLVCVLLPLVSKGAPLDDRFIYSLVALYVGFYDVTNQPGVDPHVRTYGFGAIVALAAIMAVHEIAVYSRRGRGR